MALRLDKFCCNRKCDTAKGSFIYGVVCLIVYGVMFFGFLGAKVEQPKYLMGFVKAAAKKVFELQIRRISKEDFEIEKDYLIEMEKFVPFLLTTELIASVAGLIASLSLILGLKYRNRFAMVPFMAVQAIHGLLLAAVVIWALRIVSMSDSGLTFLQFLIFFGFFLVNFFLTMMVASEYGKMRSPTNRVNTA